MGAAKTPSHAPQEDLGGERFTKRSEDQEENPSDLLIFL
jgi:hypothetical protein